MPALGKRLILRLGGKWLQGTGQLWRFVDPDLGSAAHRQMPWVPLAWLQVPSDGHVYLGQVLYWKVQDILLFASGSNSAPSCSLQLSLDNFKLQPPVTFRLAAGSGPVHLAGWHRISKD